MKIMTLIGLITLLTGILLVNELNGSFAPPEEITTVSVVELENSEHGCDSAAPFPIKSIPFDSMQSKTLYSYKNDSIIFDLHKEFFRPPSLA